MTEPTKRIDRILILDGQGKKLITAINKLGEAKVKVLDDESSSLGAVLVEIDPQALEDLKTEFSKLEVEEVQRYRPIKH